MKRYYISLLMMLIMSISFLQAKERPNILWITAEDASAKWYSCYGNENTKMPALDKLAAEGFLYTNCFAHSPVCAPARSGWILGVHPVSNGTVYMRSKHSVPNSMVFYPDVLRANGYYVSNHSKTDYNIGNRKAANGKVEGGGIVGHYENVWDNYELYNWRNPERKEGQPFF